MRKIGINLETEILINYHYDIEGTLGRLVEHFDPVRLTNISKVIIVMVSD